MHGDAKDCFKSLAKLSNDDDASPDSSYITTVEKALGEKVPAWAKANKTLLNIWLISEHNVQIDFGKTAGKKSEKDKKDKDKKKKKKKK